MKRSTNLALATALGVGLFAGAAEAQEWRDYDSLNSSRAEEGEAVRMRLTIPFQEEQERRDTRLSFAFQQGDGEGALRSVDMFSLSLAPNVEQRFETPFAFNAAGDGEGGFFSKPINWLWIGLGVGVAYAIYDANDDDKAAPAPPPPS